MKMLLLASLLAIFLPGFAKTSTIGSLILTGTVPSLVSIEVNAAGVSSSLDLAVNQTDLEVASVTEHSNSNSGYEVFISSAGAGNLLHPEGAIFPYSLKYDDVQVSLSSTPVKITDVTATNVVNVDKNVTISYSGKSPETMVAGTYSDTLTFTILAK